MDNVITIKGNTIRTHGKRYYYIVIGEYDEVVFAHSSDYAYKLLKMADREAYCEDGSMYCCWYFGKVYTNISDSIAYRVYQGERI